MITLCLEGSPRILQLFPAVQKYSGLVDWCLTARKRATKFHTEVARRLKKDIHQLGGDGLDAHLLEFAWLNIIWVVTETLFCLKRHCLGTESLLPVYERGRACRWAFHTVGSSHSDLDKSSPSLRGCSTTCSEHRCNIIARAIPRSVCVCVCLCIWLLFFMPCTCG